MNFQSHNPKPETRSQAGLTSGARNASLHAISPAEVPRQSPQMRHGNIIRAELAVLNLKQLLYRKVQRFRGGIVFKAHKLFYHSALGLRVIRKQKKS